MFVKTVKLKKPNPLAIVFVVIAVIVFVAVWGLGTKNKGNTVKYEMTDNTQRVEFLSKLGWDSSQKEVDCKIIKVPTDFNTIYNAYNKLQKQQGFDLLKHKGETVEIYTYEVYNYPDKPNNIVAHLIMSNGVLIGGDICSTEKDGFIHGLMPVNENGMKKNENAEDTRATPSPEDSSSMPDATDSTPDETKPPESSESPDETSVPDNNENGENNGFFFTN